jgi:hypothetical protein
LLLLGALLLLLLLLWLVVVEGGYGDPGRSGVVLRRRNVLHVGVAGHCHPALRKKKTTIGQSIKKVFIFNKLIFCK